MFNYRLAQIYINSKYRTILNITDPSYLGINVPYISSQYGDYTLNGEYKYRIYYSFKQPSKYPFLSLLLSFHLV